MSDLKDAACERVYLERMKKLQVKIAETGFFSFVGPAVAPQQFIDVGWGGKDSENVMLFGNRLALSRCTEKPTVVFESAEKVFYTILAFDADSTAPKEPGPYVLWCRMNVTGDIRYATGRDVVRWQPPHPREGESHRVFVVVFHQSNGEVDLSSLPLISKNSREMRGAFDFSTFRATFGLKNIIGVNCSTFGHDASVVESITAALRDKVVLDPTGKRVLREEIDGVAV